MRLHVIKSRRGRKYDEKHSLLEKSAIFALIFTHALVYSTYCRGIFPDVPAVMWAVWLVLYLVELQNYVMAPKNLVSLELS